MASKRKEREIRVKISKTPRNKSLRQTAFSLPLLKIGGRTTVEDGCLYDCEHERILLEVCSFQEKIGWNEKGINKKQPAETYRIFRQTQRSAAKRQDA